MAQPRARRDFSHIERPVGVRGIRFRSKMEANYAAYLDWLVKRGQIHSWGYETKTFWFTPDSIGASCMGLYGVRRGVTSYKPDFMVTSRKMIHGQPTESIEYHEVKGYMDPKSRTALSRMARYYPGAKVIVIDSKFMAALKRQVSKVVPGWIP